MLVNATYESYLDSHFQRQMTPVMTSYNPFGLSKVASDHVLSRQSAQSLFATNMRQIDRNWPAELCAGEPKAEGPARVRGLGLCIFPFCP